MILTIVLLPQPDGPNSADDAGGRQLELHVEGKGAEPFPDGDLQHQRPSMRRTRRANHSDSNRPPSPSTTDRIARRAAAYSPPGCLQGGIQRQRQRARFARDVRHEGNDGAEFAQGG